MVAIGSAKVKQRGSASTGMSKVFPLFVVLCLFLAVVPCFAGESSAPASVEGSGSASSPSEVEVSVFAVKEDAERLAEKIAGSGFEALVRAYDTEDGRTVYGVFVVVHEESPEGAVKPSPAELGGRVPGQERPEAPMTWKDVFSPKGGYIHASLTVAEVYTDNAFNTKTDRKSDLSTMVSPEIWLSVPRMNQRPQVLAPVSTRSPGGLWLTREMQEASRRYQTFLLFHADIPSYSKNSPSGNTTALNAQAGLAYNFPFGLSLGVNDEYSRSYDQGRNPVLAPDEVDRFKSNLFYAIAALDTGNKIRLRFDYSNFLLRYDEERNEGLDRNDNDVTPYKLCHASSSSGLSQSFPRDVSPATAVSCRSLMSLALRKRTKSRTSSTRGSGTCSISLIRSSFLPIVHLALTSRS